MQGLEAEKEQAMSPREVTPSEDPYVPAPQAVTGVGLRPLQRVRGIVNEGA